MATTAEITTRPTARRAGVIGRRIFLLAAVVLVAANLRTAVTSVGALLDQVSRDLAMPAAATALVTTLPVLCFGLIALTAPFVVRRLGARAGIAVAVGVLLAGLMLRVVAGPTALLLGTFLACAGIATANVLLPVVVKTDFGDRVGQVTGLYSAVMASGAAAGAVFTVPLSHATGGWRGGLLAWGALAAVALVAWLPHARRTAGPASHRGSVRQLLSDRVAWSVTALFATQSLLAYVIMSWLPAIFRDAGLSAAQAGGLLGLSILIGVPLNFVVPTIATRLRSQSTLAVGLTLCTAAGFAGLLAAPGTASWLWVLLLGVGGAVFPVNLVLFSLRTRASSDTAALSAMAQGVGYLLAASGPFMVGILRDSTGSWTVPLILVLTICAIQLVAARAAGRDRWIGTTPLPGRARAGR